MSSRREFGDFVRALRLACLPVGTSYNYEHEISAHLFPFTPIELHHGYLLGQERIIATHAGNFGWPGQRCLVAVRHFDRQGKLTETDFPMTITREARTAISPVDGEAVVLVRLPITLEPAGGEAIVRHMRYAEDAVSFEATISRRSILRVGDGPFAVRPGREYAATVGGRAARTIVKDAHLFVEILPGRDLAVRISAL
jgi:hypothetical protein